MPPRIAAVGSGDRVMMIQNANSGQDGENVIGERFPRMDHDELNARAPTIAIMGVDRPHRVLIGPADDRLPTIQTVRIGARSYDRV